VITVIDIERTETWVPWRKKLCNDCMALCCRLPVEVRNADLLRMELIDSFEVNDPPKAIAKRLMKAGIVAHVNIKEAIYTLVQHSSGDCMYLDRTSRRCTIYDKRPDTCRKHPEVGPRPGFCAHVSR
jgi:Fe-S-cluster containining protein